MEQNEVVVQPQQDNADAGRDMRMERYARQTRTASVFIAWVVAVWVVLSLIGGVVAVVAISHAASATPTVSPTCYSQGGTDVTC